MSQANEFMAAKLRAKIAGRYKFALTYFSIGLQRDKYPHLCRLILLKL